MEVGEAIHPLPKETRILSLRMNSKYLSTMVFKNRPFFCLPLPIHSGHRKNKKLTVLSQFYVPPAMTQSIAHTAPSHYSGLELE